jgi:hypothetical protein
MKKQYESADESQYNMSQQVTSLTSQLDQTKAQLAQVGREKEALVKNIEMLRVEKSALEKNKREINEMVSEAVFTAGFLAKSPLGVSYSFLGKVTTLGRGCIFWVTRKLRIHYEN